MFNYKKIVADLNTDDNMPDIWDCATFKFVYTPAGHVITGNFEIINDKSLRSLLNEGRKYRIPSFIDFNSCRGQTAKALQEFGIKWCCREQVDLTILLNGKKHFFDIIINALRFITQMSIYFHLTQNYIWPASYEKGPSDIFYRFLDFYHILEFK